MTNVSQHQAAKGRVRWQVIEAATGRVVREALDWNRNVILNQGLDSVAVRTWVTNFRYCAAGTGVTPTSDQSGDTTAAQAGYTVNLTGGSFVFDGAADVGKFIKWVSGEVAQIRGINSPTQAVVANTATVTGAQFTLYRTDQIGLTTEVKRTSTYLVGGAACGTTIVDHTFQHRRTFDFTAESGTVYYGEVGFSWVSTPGNNLFSRIVLDNPVQVDSGQQLRIVYELHITVSPTTATARNAIISGWPVSPAAGTAGYECLQRYGMSMVSSTGAEDNDYRPLNEPSQDASAWLSTGSDVLSAWGDYPSRTANATHAMTRAAYVAGSYTQDKSATFAVGEANQSNWRAMGYGFDNTGSGFHAAGNECYSAFVFDEAQTKESTYTLTLTWRWTWSRDFL